jgi:AraC-like DNA-binding protein
MVKRMAGGFPAGFFSTQIRAARYYCPERGNAPLALDVVCAGWEACLPEYDLSRSGFPFLAVELVAQGEGWLEIDGKRFRLRPGSAFCYGPPTTFRIVSDERRPLQKYFVDFAGRAAERIVSRGPLRLGEVRQALFPHELAEILERVIVEGNRKTALSARIAGSYLRIFFQKLHECADGARGEGSPRGLESYLRARAFVEREFTRIGRAEDAAHELGMAPETLCRLFRHYGRITPYQLLLTLRLNLAVDLLLGTDLLVKQVAERAGFDDPFHFSRVFKRRVNGMSPVVFQRMHRRAPAPHARGAGAALPGDRKAGEGRGPGPIG